MKAIQEYYLALDGLVSAFQTKYYPDSDYYIIGNENIGRGPIEVADHYWNIDQVVSALNSDIPYKVLEDYYEQVMESEGDYISLYNYYLKNA